MRYASFAFHRNRCQPRPSIFVAICIYHDFERPPQYQEHREVLVHREFLISLIPGMEATFVLLIPALITFLGIHPPFRGGLQLQIRACNVQMAIVAPCSEREAAHHLGLQDPFPRCALPDGSEEGHLR